MIAGLPYDAEVEWLQSNSDGYIDTGMAVSDKTEVEFWFNADQYANTYIPIFGVYQSDGYLGCQISYGGSPSRINAWRGTSTKSNIVETQSLDQCSGVIELKNGQWGINGTFKNFQSSAFQSTSTAWYNRVNGISKYGAVRKFGYLKMWEDGVLVRDLIPVRVGSGASAVGCMYDRVSRKLFRNAGTGAFTVGPDVATPVMGLHFFKSQIKTAKDYVQNGLIAMWDGIENAGWGQHDAEATEWKNLNESGPTLTRGSSPIAWLDNALTITSASGNNGAFSVSSSAFASSVKTVEVVASFSATNNVQCIFNIGTGVSAGVGISKTGFMSAAGKTPFTSAGDDKPKSGSWLFSGGMNSSPVECYRNGISSGTGSTADMSVGNLYLTNKFLIGSVYLAYYRFVGKIYSIRLYSRALTAEEIAANYAIDKARFNLP